MKQATSKLEQIQGLTASNKMLRDEITKLEADNTKLLEKYCHCAGELALAIKYIESKPHDDIPPESLRTAKQAVAAAQEATDAT